MNTLPPNWYPDPHKPGSERYWNGKRFTGPVRPAQGQQAPAPMWQGISAIRPPAPTGPKTWQDNVRLVPTWARAHKVIAAVVVLILIGLVGSVVGGTEPSPDDAQIPKAAADVPKETPTSEAPSEVPSEAAAEPVVEEPVTDEDLWRAAYQDKERRIFKTLARKFPAYQHPSDAENESVSTCEEIKAGVPLTDRTSRATTRWSAFESVPSAGQVAVIINLTVEHVCPDLADTHNQQVAGKEASDRRKAAAKERREARAQAREEAREERERERQEQEALEAQEEQESVSVYYANCSEVEAAGAAPIYTGDPGYSGDLDSDGDGVACEQ